jgi:hypothetical protein
MRLDAMTNEDRVAMLADLPRCYTLRMPDPMLLENGEKLVGVILPEKPLSVTALEDGGLEFEFSEGERLLDFIAETPRGWLGTALDVPSTENDACDYLSAHRDLIHHMAAGIGCD